MSTLMLDTTTTLLALSLPFAAGAAGCGGMLRAGWMYTRGELAPARILGRHHGWLLCAGGLGLGLSGTLGALSGLALPGVAALPGAGLAGLAGVIGLLGGLSGKPRPAGGVATLFFLAGAVFLAASA
jgi:hypothetical protein